MAGALIKKLSKSIASGTTGSVMMDSPCMSLGLRRLSGLTSKPATTKIGIVIRSFDNPLVEKNFLGIPPNTGKIGLPDSRVLYTVLRSPHIDKKSREQFEMRIKKRYLVIEAQRHELHKKFFWLKRQRIFGAQYEIKFTCNTRLDKGKLQQLLSGSTSFGEGGEVVRVVENLGADPTEIPKQVINMTSETAETVGADDKGEE